MTCPECGKSNFIWARTCAHCGHALTRKAFAHRPRPVIMPVLLAANLLAFVAMLVAGASPLSPDAEVLWQWGAAYGPSITAGEWWRLLTAIFLHAGILHLFFNMFALVSIGSLMERVFGHLSFLVLYLLAGLAGSIASVFWHPLTVGVGASGAIFGLYGGLFGYHLWPRKSLPGDVLEPPHKGAVGFVLYNTAFGLTQDNIDMAAHFGGLGAGVLAGIALASLVGSPGAARRAWKGLLVGVAGAASLAFAATRLPVVDDWPAALRTLAAYETRDSAAVDAAMRKVTDGGIQDDQFARLIEEQVVAPWRLHRDRIARMQRLPAKERDLAAKAIRYMDRRIAAWQLEADAFRKQDVALMEKSILEQAAASDAADDLMQSLGVKETGPTPVRNSVQASDQGVADAGARDLERAMQVVSQLDAVSMKIANTGLDRVLSGQQSEIAFAGVIETQIVEPWEAQLKRVLDLRVSGPVEGARKGAEQYMRLRGEAWRLTVQAMRTHSEALTRQANVAHMKATALLTASGAGTDAAAPRPSPAP